MKETIELLKKSGSIALTFYIPIPKSYSKKRREDIEGTPHQTKPDIDNLAKAVLDALLEDDSPVYHIQASKYWETSKGPMVEITVDV